MEKGMESKTEPILDIIIVGLEIGGLAAGLGLWREGHNFRIFE
jgi:2-polyprenyl-6-methoxyphenol hydroxylase-like FAD-dependent oxidoreductase